METLGTSPASVANFQMVDIAAKDVTQRRAIASGIFYAAPETIARIREGTLPKGDAIAMAEIAGIQAAKNTHITLPLCHPLAITSVRLWSNIEQDQITVFCEVRSTGKTGVEMEALCGVNAALLCIYDLTKVIDTNLLLKNIQLELKEGGKSGLWLSPHSAHPNEKASKSISLRSVVAAVLVLSDRCFAGETEDKAGPVAVEYLQTHDAKISETALLPDDAHQLQSKLKEWLAQQHPPSLIITSGGTGLSKRDITPETLRALCHELSGREIEGIGELLRQHGSKYTPFAWLSRSSAFMLQSTLIVCLPGSPKAVREGLEALLPLIPHVLHTASGGKHT